MQVEEITQILRESPSVRLIKSRSVDFFLSFVIEAFEGQAAIMQERLHMLLENRLDEQENTLVEDDSGKNGTSWLVHSTKRWKIEALMHMTCFSRK